MVVENLNFPVQELLGTGTLKLKGKLKPDAGNCTGNPVCCPPGGGGGGIDILDDLQTPAEFLIGPSNVNVINPLLDEPAKAGQPWMSPATLT